MVLTDKQQKYLDSLPDDRFIEAIEKLERDPFDESKSQSLYNPDELTNHRKLDFITCQELMTKKFPSLRWLIENLIPKNGFTCVSGKPKIGA